MKIAQVSPLAESVPPRLYGGTERVVSYITEELVRQGHEVILFASGDSCTKAELRPMVRSALRLAGGVRDPLAHHVLMVEKVLAAASEFDFVHFHIDYLHFPLLRRLKPAHVTTLHGRLDIPDLVPLYREFGDMPLVSISNQQRTPLPFANWQATVYHGLPEEQYRFTSANKGEYAAFLGRVSPEKGLDTAIRIAQCAGIPLKIAAKVDPANKDYFAETIKPLIDGTSVEYLGEVGEKEKCELLGGAAALLFPIDWPEPFGMVMIESLACGTPVVAYRRGSVPEVLDDGITGFICADVQGAVEALRNVARLARADCRAVFEQRFSVRRMVSDYLKVYRRLSRAGGAQRVVNLFDGPA